MLHLVSVYGLTVAVTLQLARLALAQNADLPWDGSATGLTPTTLKPKFKTHILDQRWPEAGGPEDYICINGDYITTIIDDNAKFESNRDGKLIRTDLVQNFNQPEGSKMLYKTSMLKQSKFTNSKKYQVFFTEGKLFEIHIDTTSLEKPLFQFFVQGPDVLWSGPMEYNTKYNIGILITSGQAGSVEFHMSSGDDPLVPVPGAKKEATPNLTPEFHFGMLIYEADGATLQGKDSLAFAGLSVSTDVDLSPPAGLTGGECGGPPVTTGGQASPNVTTGGQASAGGPLTIGNANPVTVRNNTTGVSPPTIVNEGEPQGGSPGLVPPTGTAGGSGGAWPDFYGR